MIDRDALCLWLARAPGLAAEHLAALAARDGDLQALAAPRAAALGDVGIPSRTIEWLVGSKPPAAGDLRGYRQAGCHALLGSDTEYPELLRRMRGAPAVLFVRGDPACLSLPQLAIVGSRNPTAGGRDTARAFAAALVAAGLAITSGLALGIDAACHEGALAADGVTLAVCAHGLDRVYPREHAALAERIVASGALVSEFVPGTPPQRGHFPQRNRVIAGLTLGTLVIEAARESGSLITARCAGDAGREVFAVPGSIHNPLARGCHALIRQGAKLVEDISDILSELSIPQPEQSVTAVHRVPAAAPRLDKAYEILLDALAFEPVSIDALLDRTGLTSESVASMLLILELGGHVESHSGGRYSRTQPRP